MSFKAKFELDLIRKKERNNYFTTSSWLFLKFMAFPSWCIWRGNGKRDLPKLWLKYKDAIGFLGHVHNYEIPLLVYENYCASEGKSHYSGNFNTTMHVVVGGCSYLYSPYKLLGA
jgi:hypothetical protein